MPRRSRSRSPRRVRGERRSRSRSPIRERRDAERGERRRDPERLDDRGLARDRTDRVDRSDRADRVDRLDRADRGDRSDRVDRGDRSDRTERVDRRDRAGSSKQPVNGSGATGVAGKKRFTAEDFAGKNDDEIEMMKTMGFGGFDTSKGKKVDGNNAGAVHVHLKRTYRQYMNRRGGFNRPLDSVH